MNRLIILALLISFSFNSYAQALDELFPTLELPYEVRMSEKNYRESFSDISNLKAEYKQAFGFLTW